MPGSNHNYNPEAIAQYRLARGHYETLPNRQRGRIVVRGRQMMAHQGRTVPVHEHQQIEEGQLARPLGAHVDAAVVEVENAEPQRQATPLEHLPASTDSEAVAANDESLDGSAATAGTIEQPSPPSSPPSPSPSSPPSSPPSSANRRKRNGDDAGLDDRADSPKEPKR